MTISQGIRYPDVHLTKWASVIMGTNFWDIHKEIVLLCVSTSIETCNQLKMKELRYPRSSLAALHHIINIEVYRLAAAQVSRD